MKSLYIFYVKYKNKSDEKLKNAFKIFEFPLIILLLFSFNILLFEQ